MEVSHFVTSATAYFSKETAITAIIAACAAALLHLLYRTLWTRNIPPGPTGLPIVGYLPFLTKHPYIKFRKLAEKYGPVFSLKLGSNFTIVLNDFQSIKEAFNDDAFFGRPPNSPFDLNKETTEKQVLSGKKWKEQRRFAVHILKDLGFGKTKMEGHIKEEICDVLERLEGTKGEPTLLRPILAPSTSNNITSLVFGRRMHHTDKRRIMLDQILSATGELAGQVGILALFPWLSNTLRFFKLGNFGKLEEAFSSMKKFLQREINEHEETLDPNNIRDYIDAYLLQIEKCKSDPDTGFIKPVLQDLVGGFFGAGSETVRVTLDWMLLILACFPDVQAKVQRELDEVIGQERFPSWTDRLNLPYVEAVMHEVMRWKTIVPINIVRYTIEESELNSYRIPNHSYVIANLWAVHNDPALWKEPTSFRPERFLSKDGKTVHKPEYLMPFSIGKRSCPGETFALIEVFLYFTAIMQKFEVILPEGAVPNFEGELGIALQLKPQKLIIKRRQ